VRRIFIWASLLTVILAAGVGWFATTRASAAVPAVGTVLTAQAKPLPTVKVSSSTTTPQVTIETVAQPATPPQPHITAPSTQQAKRHETPPVTKTAPAVPSKATPATATSGCAAALTYLASHSAPGFSFECPGYALGHQAMTCINVPGTCPNAKLIVIAVACQASWMNEASNSWVLSGLASRPIDPYGYCH